MSIRKFVPLALIAFTGLTACAEDIYAPSMDEVAGTYTLTELVVTQGNASNDLIAEGVTTTVTLAADGTTSGALFIPASVNIDGEDIMSDVVGTWSIDTDQVRFELELDTHMNIEPWTYSPEGTLTISANFMEATMVRQ